MLLRALARQHGLLPFFGHFQAHLFSQSLDQNHKWSQSAQQAFMANQIIKMIINPEFPQTFEQKSLRQRIVEHKYENKFFKIQNDNPSEGGVLSMFTDGIILDPILFKQQRVNSAKQDHPNKQQQKFIFHPNYIVTPQIFKILRDDDFHTANTNMLITGNYGIAKTVSIILYFQLSNKIHKFFYQSNKDQDKKKERETLLNNSLIENNIPQIWYWSVNWIDIQELGYQNLIMHEIPYLSAQDKEKLQKLIYKTKVFRRTLKTMFPSSYKIYIKLVVDQINAVASMARKWHAASALYYRRKNALGNQKNQLLKLYYEERLYQDLKDYKMPAERALSFISDMKRFASKKIANSSMNIQDNLLGKSDDWQNKIGLNLDGHDRLKKIKIEYEPLIEKNLWAKVQFWNYFFFQFSRLLNTDAKKQFEDNKNKIIKLLVQQIQKKQQIAKTPQNSTKEGKKQANFNVKIKAYYRLLYIRKHLKGQSFTIQSINQNPSTITQKIAYLISNFTFTAIVLHGERLKEFIYKNQNTYQQKITHLLSIYEQAQQQNNKKIKNFWITQNEFYRFVKTEEVGIDCDQSLLNKQFFGFEIKNGKCQFALTPSEFMQVVSPILFPELQKYYPVEIYYYYNNKTFMGCALQTFLKQNLVNGAIFSFQIGKAVDESNKNNQNQVKQIMRFQKITQKISMNISNKDLINFYPMNTALPANLDQNDKLISPIRRNFQNLFNNCKSSPENYFAAIPTILQEISGFSSKQLTDHESASVDFAIAVYKDSKFHLYTVDCTVAKDQKSFSNLSQKQNKAKKLFQTCLADSDQEIEVTHIILSPALPKKIRRQIYSPMKNLKITYANWNNLKVTNQSNRMNESMLKKIIQMTSRQTEKYLETAIDQDSQSNKE